MASAFKYAVQQEIEDQPTWLRYKASIIIIVTGLVTIVTQLATSPDLADTWLAPVLTAIATGGAFILNRFTKDGLTPSMGQKIESAAGRFYADIPFETEPSYTPQPAPELGYEGRHRTETDGIEDGAYARQVVEHEYRKYGGANEV